MKITELKFTAGANASVRAKVTPRKPTEEEMIMLDTQWEANRGNYAEWPVKEIQPSKDGPDFFDYPSFDLTLWTDEIITVFTPNYVRWNRFDEKEAK